MNPWQQKSLNLKVGDFIIWQDEAVEVEGQPAVVTPGMKGEVISLQDSFHLDVAEVEPIPPKAVVRFDSGITLMVDERMRWEAGCWLTREGPASNRGASGDSTCLREIWWESSQLSNWTKLNSCPSGSLR